MKHHSEQPDRQPVSEEERLVEFLQLHSPATPIAPAELEDQIMAVVCEQPLQVPVTRIQSLQRPLWQRVLAYAMPAAVMVGLPLVWLGQALSPPRLTATEYVQLEAFLETNWDDLSASRDRPGLSISDVSNQYD
jgi:hypothetical protein